MPGILVIAANAAGEIAASAITDADGSYRLTGLGEGEHVLVAGGHEPVRTPSGWYMLVTSGYQPGVTMLPAGGGPRRADIMLTRPE